MTHVDVTVLSSVMVEIEEAPTVIVLVTEVDVTTFRFCAGRLASPAILVT